MYPFKAGKVPALVEEKSGVHISNNDHAKAWRHYRWAESLQMAAMARRMWAEAGH